MDRINNWKWVKKLKTPKKSKHVEVLHNLYSDLTNGLYADDIIPHLVAKRIISNRQVQIVNNKSKNYSREDGNEEVIRILMQQDEKTFFIFVKILEEINQGTMANALRQAYSKISSEDEEGEMIKENKEIHMTSRCTYFFKATVTALFAAFVMIVFGNFERDGKLITWLKVYWYIMPSIVALVVLMYAVFIGFIKEDPIRKAEFYLKDIPRNLYKDAYSRVPRIPWIFKDFIPISKIFVNLVLQDNSDYRRRNKPYHDYSEIFDDPILEMNRYIITGNSGSGKTTLTQKISYDWAISDVSQFKLLILLKAREFLIGESVIGHIIRIYFGNSTMDTNILKSKLNEQLYCPETLLIIDGLDELKDKSNDNELIKIIKGEKYKSLSILATSRPHALADLGLKDGETYYHLSVEGFGKESVLQYAVLYFNYDLPNITVKMFNQYQVDKQTDKIGEDYFTKLSTNSEEIRRLFNLIGKISERNLWEIVENPLCCLLVCFIWEHKQTLPEKLTFLYRELVAAFKNTYVEVKEHPESWDAIVTNIGKLAFDKLMNEKEGTLIFEEDVVKQYIANPEIACKTGILTKIGFLDVVDNVQSDEWTLVGATATTWYQFIHKSLQEYLAAHYLQTSLANREDESLLRFESHLNTYKSPQSFKLFLLFISGLGSISKEPNAEGIKVFQVVEEFLCKHGDDIGYSMLTQVHKNQLNCWVESCKKGKYTIPVEAFWTITFSSSIYEMSDIQYLRKIHEVIRNDNQSRLNIRKLSISNVESKVPDYMLSNSIVLRNVQQEQSQKYSITKVLADIMQASPKLKSLLIMFSDFEGDDFFIRAIPISIEEIHLQHWEMSPKTLHTLIRKLSNLTHLQYLSLSFHHLEISGLDLGIALPVSIEILQIYNNEMSSRNTIALMENIPKLTKLKTLYFHKEFEEEDNTLMLTPQRQTSNEIKNALLYLEKVECVDGNAPPYVIEAMLKPISLAINLKELWLGGNRIGEIGSSLAAVISNSIEVIILGTSHLTLEGMKAFIQNIPKWHNLRELYLDSNKQSKTHSSNELDTLNDDIEHEEDENLSLEVVNLSKCEVNPSLISFLAKRLRLVKYLKKLDLSFNNIGNAGVLLASVVHQSITTLNLASCNLTRDSIQSILNNIGRWYLLEELRLNDNPIKDDQTPDHDYSEEVKPLHGQTKRSLQQLNMANCHIHVRKFPIVLSTVKSALYLEKLDLSNNFIDTTSASQLYGVLSPRITSLNLSNCSLSSDTTKMFTKHVKKWTLLVDLDLSQNDLQHGIEELSEALPTSIKVLKIHQNNIREQGKLSLIQQLTRMVNLEVLNISIKPGEDKALQNFIHVIPKCKRLKEYWVYDATEDMRKKLPSAAYKYR